MRGLRSEAEKLVLGGMLTLAVSIAAGRMLHGHAYPIAKALWFVNWGLFFSGVALVIIGAALIFSHTDDWRKLLRRRVSPRAHARP